MFTEPIEHRNVAIEESGIAEIDVEEFGQRHGVDFLGEAGGDGETYLVLGGETMDEPDAVGIVFGTDEDLAPADRVESLLMLSLEEGMFSLGGVISLHTVVEPSVGIEQITCHIVVFLELQSVGQLDPEVVADVPVNLLGS